MKEDLLGTKDFIQEYSGQLAQYIARISPAGFDWIFLMIVKITILGAVFFLVDVVMKIVLSSIFKLYKDDKKYPVIKSVHQSRITHSFAHLIALAISAGIHPSIFVNALPKTNTFVERAADLGLVLIIAGMLYRALTAFRNYSAIKQDFYKVMAINAVSETVKILGIFIFTIVGICVIFGIKGTTIVGSLGAITAVLVLVFRDTILGFVTGIHVATSKSLKVGDWIGIPKYNIEGHILDISLLTTKIANFDKTISSVPTYDLLTTEIKNLQVMSESNTRRIKKSIFFNINSFKFLTDEDISRLKNINLISDYLEHKTFEISQERSKNANSDLIINGRQLTNIGVFRWYAQKYLENDPDVEQENPIMVRQLEITPQGLPLEIYCFANDSRWEHFEQIQADIFDHLLVASKEFDLQVTQISLKV